jgi:type IV pilus assembly protein PilE
MAIPVTVRNRQRERRSAGFTLIEMVIIVIIVGILTSIALPAYQDSMRKGRRADAKAALMTAANRQESLMLDRKTYTTNMVDLGFTQSPMLSENGHYSIAAAACAGGTIANCYMLTATPVADGAQDGDARCTTIKLDSTGAKTATGSANTECW